MQHSSDPLSQPASDLVGMLQWCQNHIDELTEAETLALATAMSSASDPDGVIRFDDDDPARHADLRDVVLRIADRHALAPVDDHHTE